MERQPPRLENKVVLHMADYADDLDQLLARGRSCLDDKRYDEALAYFDRALELSPRDASTYGWKITALRLKPDLDAAERAIDEALSVLPEDQHARILHEKGMLSFDRRQHRPAISAFERALALEADYKDALEWKLIADSDLLRLEGACEAAHKVLEEALELMPRSVHLHNERGLVYHDERRYQLAIDSFDEALEIFPESDFAIEWRFLAECALVRAEGRWADLGKLLAEPPPQLAGNPSYFAERGWLELGQRKPQEAARDFRRCTELRPEFVEAHVGLGRAMAELGHADEAEDAFRQAINLRPGLPEAYVGLGWALGELKRVEEAEEAFLRATEMRPNFPEAFVGLGVVLLESPSRLADSEKAFRQAIELAPESAQGHAGLAVALARLEQFSEAEGEFERAIRLGDTSLETVSNLCCLLANTGKPERAERYLHTALLRQEGSRGSLEASATWATIFLDLADRYNDDDYYHEAIEEVRRALRRDRSVSRAQDNAVVGLLFLLRGNALAKLGQYGKAKLDFRRCMDAAPHDSEIAFAAQRNLRRVNSRLRSQFSIPGWLPYVLFGVSMLVLLYGIVLVEAGDLEPTSLFPIVITVFVVTIAGFSLPSMTRFKVGGAELEKTTTLVSPPRLDTFRPPLMPPQVLSGTFLEHLDAHR